MIDLGYEKDGLEESEVFSSTIPKLNPTCKSILWPLTGIQPSISRILEALAKPRDRRDAGRIERGPGARTSRRGGPTERPSLKGVHLCGQKNVTYTAKGVKREQGWIYAFADPTDLYPLYGVGKRRQERF